MYFEETYLVDSRATDPQGLCRPSSLQGYLQEAATKAAVELHASTSEMRKRYNAFWMTARIWYRLNQPLRWGERVTVRTWHRGGKGASMYRDFDLTRDGQPIGEAVSIWVLADIDTRQLFRLSKATEFQDTTGGDLCKDILLPKLRVPGPLTPAGARALHYSDADINAHVNNVRYADFVCDALKMEVLGLGNFVSQLQVGYLAECLPGETLQMATDGFDGKWYVEGTGPEGKPRFDAALTLSPLDNPLKGV